jgi:hypothetical protein
MSDPINFEIEALVARYELHPERRDVFVEGESDQGLVRTFLDRRGLRNISVLSVAVVNVPPASVLNRALPHPSRRSEVIALAFELEGRGVSLRQVACIADADLEFVLPQNLACSLLLLTDYASMELYAFSPEAVQNVLFVVSPKTEKSGSDLVADLTGPLEFLFAVQATNFDLQFKLAWIKSIEKFFSIKAGRIKFDEKEFRERYITIHLSPERLKQFEVRLKEISSIVCSDARRRIRGHDFVKLLAWYLRKSEKCTHLNEDAVRQMLYVGTGPEQLASEATFSSLLDRLAP